MLLVWLEAFTCLHARVTRFARDYLQYEVILSICVKLGIFRHFTKT